MSVNSSSGVVATASTAGSATLTYTYSNSNGCSNSRTIAGTVAVCASRGFTPNIVQNSTNFKLYPNPTQSIVNIYVETLVGSGTIVITDLYGKQVKQQVLSMGQNSIDVSKLAKAVYFVSILTQDGKQIQKLLVE